VPVLHRPRHRGTDALAHLHRDLGAPCVDVGLARGRDIPPLTSDAGAHELRAAATWRNLLGSLAADVPPDAIDSGVTGRVGEGPAVVTVSRAGADLALRLWNPDHGFLDGDGDAAAAWATFDLTWPNLWSSISACVSGEDVLEDASIEPVVDRADTGEHGRRRYRQLSHGLDGGNLVTFVRPHRRRIVPTRERATRPESRSELIMLTSASTFADVARSGSLDMARRASVAKIVSWPRTFSDAADLASAATTSAASPGPESIATGHHSALLSA
jgi:hypothetical protein